MLALRVDRAASDRATALLASDDPGCRQSLAPTPHTANIGEQKTKVIPSVDLPTLGPTAPDAMGSRL